MANKRFCQDLFNENDEPARAAGKRYWGLAEGVRVEDNADRYGPDLIVHTMLGSFYCEVEIKKVWKGKEFQYDTLQIAARKGKYLDLPLPVSYIVFNDDQTYGYLCPGTELALSPIVEVPNKYNWSGEMFYQVPIDHLTLIEVPLENRDE